MIKVGSKVKVINQGRIFTTFNTMFRKMDFNNKGENYGREFNYDSPCEVFSIAEHPTTGYTLCGVRDNEGNEILIGIEGLEFISNPFNTDKEFDLLKDFCTKLKLEVTSEDIFKYILRKLN